MKSSTPLKLNSFTCLAFLINRVIDAGPDTDLSYREIFDAASERRLIPLLADRYGQNNAFTFVTQAGNNLEQMEAALADAAAGFEGRIGKPTGPVSGLSLALNIVLETIQQQFCYKIRVHPWSFPAHQPSTINHQLLPVISAPAPAQPFLPFVNRPGNGLPQPGTGLRSVCPPLRQVCPSVLVKAEPLLAETPRGNDAQPGLTLSAFLQLALIVNSLADSPSEADLPFCEVHAAVRQGRFLELLAEYSGRFPDFSFLQSPSGSFQELGTALRAASAALESREFVTAGVSQNGYCLALALVLEAMCQKFPAHLTCLNPSVTPSEKITPHNGK